MKIVNVSRCFEQFRFFGKQLVLVGKKFWAGLLDWIKNTLLEEGNISEEDLNLFRVVDTAEEAVDHFNKFYAKYKLKPNF